MTSTEDSSPSSCELSIVMPCLNEVRTLESCVRKAQDFLQRHGVLGEVIVADNGSTDGSQALAERLGTRVVPAAQRGYGAALRAGFGAARGRYVVMGDSDDSYDFSSLAPFLECLRAGDDLVMGNRFRGGIAPGAMPVLHRNVGNPLLTLIANVFFGVPARDVYCGLRGMSRAAFGRLDMQSSGMEFALEMLVKAKLLGMRISEVPTTLSRDRRGRPPHLQTWRDGRRSLLLYLASMPQGLFLYPGLVLLGLGLVAGAILAAGPISFHGVHFDVHTLLLCGTAVFLGFQLVAYSVVLRFLMITARLLPPQPRFMAWLGRLKLEHGLGAGLALAFAGLTGVLRVLRMWEVRSFGDLDPFSTMRIAIPSVTAIALGIQVAFASLFLSLVKWQVRSRSSG
jgi:glycosyltransferase involved in cell wall biosynthesis